jgi:hypothetical protein
MQSRHRKDRNKSSRKMEDGFLEKHPKEEGH